MCVKILCVCVRVCVHTYVCVLRGRKEKNVEKLIGQIN